MVVLWHPNDDGTTIRVDSNRSILKFFFYPSVLLCVVFDILFKIKIRCDSLFSEHELMHQHEINKTKCDQYEVRHFYFLSTHYLIAIHYQYAINPHVCETCDEMIK